MKTTTRDFHSMRGHVEDGCVICAPSGKEFTLKSTMRGWMILGPDGSEVSGYLPSAGDVEMFVIHGLSAR